MRVGKECEYIRSVSKERDTTEGVRVEKERVEKECE